MRVLVACEESQAVCLAFRERAHEAYSCDIQEPSGGHPEWHIRADALELLKLPWDLIIAHPPCTYMANSGAVRMRVKRKNPAGTIQKGDGGKGVFYGLLQCKLPKNCHREPNANETDRTAAVHAGNTAV